MGGSARKLEPIDGAQWTGIVSTLASEMLNRGLVEGVVWVQNTEGDRFQPAILIEDELIMSLPLVPRHGDDEYLGDN